jgi:type I restriction enzyme M protein
METRVTRVFDEADVAKIATAYHAWRTDGETKEKYQNISGFVCAARKEEVKAHDYILTPGRHVGAEEVEDDDETFAEKMVCLTQQLKEQMEEGEMLDVGIREQLKKVGYGF